MTHNSVANSHANEMGQSYYASLWGAAMRQMEDDERAIFLQRLCRIADRDRMVNPVLEFMSQCLTRDPTAMKKDLREIMSNMDTLKRSNLRTAYILNSVYFTALEKEAEHAKAADVDQQFKLSSDDLKIMAQGFSVLKYSPKVFDAVQEQSGIILALDQVLQFHHAKGFDDWDQATPKLKADYMTRLSRATDYAYNMLFKTGWVEDEFVPPVEMHETIMGEPRIRGSYHDLDNRIVLRQDLGKEQTMLTFQHEKAHQLSYALHQDKERYKNGWMPREEYYIYDLGKHALTFLQQHSERDDYLLAYRAAVEERLARSAEIRSDAAELSCHLYLEEMKEIFDVAPSEYNYMKEAFHRFEERSEFAERQRENAVFYSNPFKI